MYGVNGTALRTELATLLKQHRIQQRIGGSGTYTVPETTTAAERQAIGELIQRYRCGILTWCHQAVKAADPNRYELRYGSTLTPAAAFARRLAGAVEIYEQPLPTLEELTTPQSFPLVEAWRGAARAAALAEHDLGGPNGCAALSATQRFALVTDAADIVRGLLVLDLRYKNVPGWQALAGSARLRRDAEAAARLTITDYAVDARGWRPAPSSIAGPARPGIDGVVQAEHNLLVALRDPPNALNLRRILQAQGALTRGLLPLLESSEPARSSWEERAEAYALLGHLTQNLGGLIGNGGPAAGEAANAVSRLRAVPLDTTPDPRACRKLDDLFQRIDHRIADVLEYGASHRHYFIAERVRGPLVQDGRPVLHPPERFVPVDLAAGAPLLGVVRERLRTPRHACPPDPAPTESRHHLRKSLHHRPAQRRTRLTL